MGVGCIHNKRKNKKIDKFGALTNKIVRGPKKGTFCLSPSGPEVAVFLMPLQDEWGRKNTPQGAPCGLGGAWRPPM